LFAFLPFTYIYIEINIIIHTDKVIHFSPSLCAGVGSGLAGGGLSPLPAPFVFSGSRLPRSSLICPVFCRAVPFLPFFSGCPRRRCRSEVCFSSSLGLRLVGAASPCLLRAFPASLLSFFLAAFALFCVALRPFCGHVVGAASPRLRRAVPASLSFLFSGRFCAFGRFFAPISRVWGVPRGVRGASPCSGGVCCGARRLCAVPLCACLFCFSRCLWPFPGCLRPFWARFWGFFAAVCAHFSRLAGLGARSASRGCLGAVFGACFAPFSLFWVPLFPSVRVLPSGRCSRRPAARPSSDVLVGVPFFARWLFGTAFASFRVSGALPVLLFVVFGSVPAAFRPQLASWDGCPCS